MGYTLREHTADVAVEATGETLGEAVGATAEGMAAAMSATWPDGGEEYGVEVEAETLQAALFDYLDDLIYQRDVRSVLPVDNDVTVQRTNGGVSVEGTFRGIPLAALSARDLKAVTYSEMTIEETADGWRTYVVFDV